MKISFRGLFRVVALTLFLSSHTAMWAIPWFPFGPEGGDTRAFAGDPHDHKHIYLGTLTGWIYESHDSGASWKRLARVDSREDLAVDNILVDPSRPQHIIVGAWVLGGRADGGIYISENGGKTWVASSEMKGQSVRSLAQSVSNPAIFVSGTLEGIFRSEDGGSHWKQISPIGSEELHEVESIAIDPSNPKVIYAGTWHLPWKTTDGGAKWNIIKEGIIEDSDVFSIIVQPNDPKTVYASACSGIYKSDNSGTKFTKVQGIPSTARRTRVLMQDSGNTDIVFAGTTEGLWRTADAGKKWLLTTDPSLIINDVFIDPDHHDHILLATDHSGVLSSNDGGFTFHNSNGGFSSRQVVAYVADERNPAKVYVGVVNDKTAGGVFMSENGGLSWSQNSLGLDGLDVLSLVQAPDGTILAGTTHGIYRLQGGSWGPSSGVRPVISRPSPKGKPGAVRRPAPVASPSLAKSEKKFDGPVYAMMRSGLTLWAVTGGGILESADSGTSWHPSGLETDVWRFGSVFGSRVAVAGLKTIELRDDAKKTWHSLEMPSQLTQISAIELDAEGNLWTGGREGVFLASPSGTWSQIPDLHVNDVNSLHYDAAGQRMLITANNSTTMTYGVHLQGKEITFWDTGWHMRFVRPMGDHLIGATLFDGIVLQPRMVASPDAGDSKASR